MLRCRNFLKSCITIFFAVVMLLSMVSCGTSVSDQPESVSTENSTDISNATEISITAEASKNSVEGLITEVGTELTGIQDSPVESSPVVIEDTSLDDELSELAAMDTDELTSKQRSAVNMLNYMTVLTQEINAATHSRLILDAADSELYNNIYSDAVDTKTQAQITSMLNTIHKYQMISVKRERLEYIYEQNQAQALRSAIPSPVALLSAVQSGNLLKSAASVLYMAVDSITSYEAASSQAELQYLQSGWVLDDEESEAIHDSRINALNYRFNMARDNSIPGDYVLSEESVNSFVSWKNNTNLVRKIAWFEANQTTYQEFGPYWLELAKDYYNAEEYEDCLNAFTKYEEVTTRIFSKDYDYAEALPMAIIAAKETMCPNDYITFAEKYTQVIRDNTNDDDWQLRYFVVQIYLDMYANSSNSAYIDMAYQITFNNVNNLITEQQKLNQAYLSKVEEIKIEKDATKQQKEDAKQYNKLLESERKVALPPVSKALYLNCDLLFALAEEKGISTKEQNKIDSILHENGESIFLTSVLDERFRYNSNITEFDANEVSVEFYGDKFEIPASCVSDKSTISITITGPNENTVIEDWVVDKVDRPDNANCSNFIVTYTSENANDYDYTVGETITITIVPIVESPDEVLSFKFNVVDDKKFLVFNGITFERKYNI